MIAGLGGRTMNVILEGAEGVPRNGGSQVATGLHVFYSQRFTSEHLVERCSIPLPWDPLSFPLNLVSPHVAGLGGRMMSMNVSAFAVLGCPLDIRRGGHLMEC